VRCWRGPKPKRDRTRHSPLPAHRLRQRRSAANCPIRQADGVGTARHRPTKKCGQWAAHRPPPRTVRRKDRANEKSHPASEQAMILRRPQASMTGRSFAVIQSTHASGHPACRHNSTQGPVAARAIQCARLVSPGSAPYDEFALQGPRGAEPSKSAARSRVSGSIRQWPRSSASARCNEASCVSNPRRQAAIER